MSDTKETIIKDSSKYLEGNYSDNAFISYFEKIEDSIQADKLSIAEEYLKRYLKQQNKQREDYQYLVDGAILRCTGCTTDSVTPFDKTFYAPVGSDEVILKVTSNTSHINDAGQIFATIKDCSVDNISAFGNCKNLPDREDEKAEIKLAESSDELLKLGTCRCLRKLNECWETDPSTVYEEKGIENDRDHEITMESILFCKHGGFIYPIDSGYIPSEIDEPEETELTKEKAIEILKKYLQDGNGEEVFVIKALEYLAGQSGCQLPHYNSRLDKDYDRYDMYILGWTEYYNEILGIEINPRYIKAQIFEESEMGYTESQKNVLVANSATDIMQVLDIRNYNIYDYIGISMSKILAPTNDEKYESGYISGTELWKINLGQKGYAEPEPNSWDKEKKDRCGGIVASLFNTESDGSGECYTENSNNMYYFLHDKVTPVMSIGMGMDKMSGLLNENNMNYKDALTQYNNNPDIPDYASNIIQRAESSYDPLDPFNPLDPISEE